MDKNNIVSAFSDYFELVLANTPELLSFVYNIRYQVYCQEFHYEAEDKCPDGREQDEFDKYSQHCLMIHRETRRPVGCIRLIDPNRNGIAMSLPFETFCPPTPAYDINPNQLLRGSFGEFSRLAVTSSFRRRQEDEKKPLSLPEEIPSDPQGRRSRFPYIPVGLFMAGMSMFLNTRMNFAFAMMEPRLVRLLKRFGIVFTQVGNVIDYHGPRAAFVLPRKPRQPC